MRVGLREEEKLNVFGNRVLKKFVGINGEYQEARKKITFRRT
jgi:hypothetical protein